MSDSVINFLTASLDEMGTALREERCKVAQAQQAAAEERAKAVQAEQEAAAAISHSRDLEKDLKIAALEHNLALERWRELHEKELRRWEDERSTLLIHMEHLVRANEALSAAAPRPAPHQPGQGVGLQLADPFLQQCMQRLRFLQQPTAIAPSAHNDSINEAAP